MRKKTASGTLSLGLKLERSYSCEGHVFHPCHQRLTLLHTVRVLATLLLVASGWDLTKQKQITPFHPLPHRFSFKMEASKRSGKGSLTGDDDDGRDNTASTWDENDDGSSCDDEVSLMGSRAFASESYHLRSIINRDPAALYFTRLIKKAAVFTEGRYTRYDFFKIQKDGFENVVELFLQKLRGNDSEPAACHHYVNEAMLMATTEVGRTLLDMAMNIQFTSKCTGDTSEFLMNLVETVKGPLQVADESYRVDYASKLLLKIVQLIVLDDKDYDDFWFLCTPLLELGADPNYADDDGRTICHHFLGNWKMDRNLQDYTHVEPTAGIMDALKGHEAFKWAVVREFHEVHGADLSVTCKNNWSLLHTAAGMGYHTIIRRLLETSDDKFVLLQTADCEYGHTPLHVACLRSGNGETIAALLQIYEDLNLLAELDRPDYHGISPFIYMCENATETKDDINNIYMILLKPERFLSLGY